MTPCCADNRKDDSIIFLLVHTLVKDKCLWLSQSTCTVAQYLDTCPKKWKDSGYAQNGIHFLGCNNRTLNTYIKTPNRFLPLTHTSLRIVVWSCLSWLAQCLKFFKKKIPQIKNLILYKYFHKWWKAKGGNYNLPSQENYQLIVNDAFFRSNAK